jgi:hypothetical protein
LLSYIFLKLTGKSLLLFHRFHEPPSLLSCQREQAVIQIDQQCVFVDSERGCPRKRKPVVFFTVIYYLSSLFSLSLSLQYCGLYSTLHLIGRYSTTWAMPLPYLF